MALRYTALLLIIVLLAASVSAQESICDFFHVPPLQCEICGYTPSAPVYCIAYNATVCQALRPLLAASPCPAAIRFFKHHKYLP